MEKKRSDSFCCCSVLEESFETVRDLGEGGQGIVMLCRDRASGRLVACKTASSHKLSSCCKKIRKRKLVEINAQKQLQKKKKKAFNAQDAQIRWEANVLGKLRGEPGIVPLERTLEGEDGCIHLLTTYCNGGDLFNKLQLAPECRLYDRQAARVIASVAHALASCHSLGLVHRDVKPQNVFLQRSKEGADVEEEEEFLLADFGLAAHISPGQSLCEPAGSCCYMAPEVIRHSYDHRADIWSLGVVLHLLLTTTLPFMHLLDDNATDAAIQKAILHNNLDLDSSILSPEACDILTGMLCKDPARRLTIDQVLHHPWVIINTRFQTHLKIKNVCPPVDPVLAAGHAGHSTGYGAAHPPMVAAEEDDEPPRKIRTTVGRDCYRQHWRQRRNAIATPACICS